MDLRAEIKRRVNEGVRKELVVRVFEKERKLHIQRIVSPCVGVEKCNYCLANNQYIQAKIRWKRFYKLDSERGFDGRDSSYYEELERIKYNKYTEMEKI